jgi:predicted transcriptional regulator
MNEKIKNYYYDRRTVGLSDEQIARNLGMDPATLKDIINGNTEKVVPEEIKNTFENVEHAEETPTVTPPTDQGTATFMAEIVEKVKKPAWSDPES